MSDASAPAVAPFASTEWLAAHLSDPAVQVVDASWYLPAQNRDPRAEYEAKHIPGAVFFDIDGIADTASGLPHMLLDADRFGQQAGALGLSSDTTIVVYDGAGLFSAPRVWWTLRVFGARDVRILQGGFPQWLAENRPVESGLAKATPANFNAKQAPGAVADLAAVRSILNDGSAQVVDARPAARFRGEAPEPRPGLKSGHMPGSYNVPSSELIRDGRLKPPAELLTIFREAGVDPDRKIIASCGSGVTAAIVVLALETLGRSGAGLYDGSWAEYGAHTDVPVEVG